MFNFHFWRIGTLLFLVSPPLQGGGLDSPAGPDDPASAMYSVETVYQRLAAGALGAKRSGAFGGSPEGIGSTGHTLNDVMAAAPLPDNANGAKPEDVACGKTYWGLRTDGNWGLRAGTSGCGGSAVTPPAGAFRDTLVGGGQGPLMMPLPGGMFRMGDIQGGGYDDEQPVHNVTIAGFAMGVYEVTNAEYVTFLNSVKRRGTAEEPWFYTKAESLYSHITAGLQALFRQKRGMRTIQQLQSVGMGPWHTRSG
ncbi:MAG: formylglycine-generating enzyme family protein [Gammaproteobacteria bacterium]|nr:formylglycine-generating enzyme family protein [Gammaproteobacteria bacterium]